MSLGMLWRIAARNVKRHRAQAIAAAATVAVGTAVLAASLLAGQAAQAGITEVAFDVLGETDEMVRSEGDFLFPQDAADDFAERALAQRSDLSISPAIVHPGVAGTADGLTEPDMFAIGFPPEERGFGSFDAVEGEASLAPGGVLVNEDLARPLDLQAGDTLTLRYAEPSDPVIPTVHTFSGNVTSAKPPGPVPGVPGLPSQPAGEATVTSFDLPVNGTATRIVAVLGWADTSGQNSTDLDLALILPDGTRFENTNGSTGEPDTPAVIDVPADQGGSWTIEVSAKAAVEQPFRVVAVVLEPAFSLEELREGRERLAELGPLGERLEEQARPTRAVDLTVRAVVSGDGKGGFLGEPAVFLPLDELQRLLDRPEDVNLVRISNPGGVREGLEHTEAVMPVLEDALEGTKATFEKPSVQALAVESSKADIVDRAERAGAQFTRFLTTLSSFTIVAGILLVINLFTMLGEERRVELSVMRALGMRRHHLVGSLTLEGTLYGLPGAPIGALAGLGLAYGLIEAVNELVVGQDGLPIPFVVDPWTLVLAAILGLVFTIVAVAVTGWRMSTLHVASGLKNRPDPGRVKREVVGLVLVALGGLTTAAFWLTGLYTTLIVGPAALIWGAVWLAGRRLDERTARFLASLAVIPYELWTIQALPDIPVGEVPIVAPTRGVILVIMAVIALLNTPGLPRLLKALARRFKRAAPASMVALAYPTRRQVRTGLTASMFALILLVLAFFSAFFTVFEVDPATEAGGYDIQATTRLPIEELDSWAQANLETRPSSLDSVTLTDELAMARVVGGDILTIEGKEVNYNGPPIDVFYGVGEGFVENNGYDLVSRSDRLSSDQAAYQALLEEPDTAIVSRVYDVDEAGRLGRIQGGERMHMELGGRSANVTILGAQQQLYLGGVFMDRETVEDLFPGHGTTILIRVDEDADPANVARQLERDFQTLGLDAESIRAEALEIQELNARFFTVLQVFLGLGLVIGVASLGIVTAKSALEREHELGVMRAMGVPSWQITASLVGEALFTALLGIIPGVFIGIAAAYAAFLAFFAGAGATFSIPWASMLWLSLISLAATLVSTIPPARKAARADISKAVRIEL